MLACALLLALWSPAEAQPVKKIPRIGFLAALSASAISARVEAFQQGLAELGYVEGKNIVVEYRWANGKFEQVPALAAELVNSKLDIIVTAGPTDRHKYDCNSDGIRQRSGRLGIRCYSRPPGWKYYGAIDAYSRNHRKAARASERDRS